MADMENFDKMTIMQLKKAAKNRNIDNTGKKEDLIKRLKEYEVKAKRAATEEDMKVDPEEPEAKETAELSPEEQVGPHLASSMYRWGHQAQNALRTVILHPVKMSLFQNKTFLSWVEEANSMTVKKSIHGNDAVKLIYSTVSKGDAAYTDLKNEMSKENQEVTVIHPTFSKNGTFKQIMLDDEFEGLVKDEPLGILSDRSLVIEKLPPEMNTDEKLVELFPEAFKVYSFEYAFSGKGIAILEFFTEEEAKDFIELSGHELEIEGTEVLVFKLPERQKHWDSLHSKLDRLKAKEKEKMPKEEKQNDEVRKIMTDEERLELVKEIKELQEQLDKMHHDDDVFGVDKLERFTQVAKETRTKTRKLTFDTKRRVKDKVDIPEPESEMIEITKKFAVKDYMKKGDGSEIKADQMKVLTKKRDMAQDIVTKITDILDYMKVADHFSSRKQRKQAKKLTQDKKNGFEGKKQEGYVHQDGGRDKFNKGNNRGGKFDRPGQKRSFSNDGFRSKDGPSDAKRYSWGGTNRGMANRGGMSNMGRGMFGAGSGMSNVGPLMSGMDSGRSNNMGFGMSGMGSGLSNMGSGMSNMGSGMSGMGSGMSGMGSGMSNMGYGMGGGMNNMGGGATSDMRTSYGMGRGMSDMGRGGSTYGRRNATSW